MANSMDDKELYKNISINIFLKPVSMLLSYLYIPLSLSYLGDERYGVWATISSFVTWFSVCDIGIGNGMRNKLAESYAVGDKKKSREIVSTSYGTISLISLIVLAIYTLINIVFDIPGLLNINVAGDNVKFAMWITVFFVCLNFVLTLSNTITYSIQKPAISSFTAVLTNTLNIIFVLVCRVFWPANMIIIALTLGSSGAIVNFGLNIYLFRSYSFLRPNLYDFKKDRIKSIASLGVLFFFGQIATLVMNSTDNMLISIYFGATDVTPYSTSYKLFSTFIHLQGVIIMPMWSAFTNAKAKGEKSWIIEKFRKMQLLTFFLSICVVALLFLIKPISKIWLGREMFYDSTMLIIMAVYFVVYLYFNNYASLLCGLGDVKLYSIFAIVSSVANILFSLLFAVKLAMGSAGIIMGTLVSLLPYLLILVCKTNIHLKNLKR